MLLSGAEVKIACKRMDTIVRLKCKVAFAVSKPYQALHLFDVDGRELLDGDSIADAGLRRNPCITLVCDASRIPVHFRVMLPAGHLAYMDAFPAQRIVEIKRRVRYLVRASQNFIRVHDADGRELENNISLADAGVTEGSVVHINLDVDCGGPAYHFPNSDEEDDDDEPPPLMDVPQNQRAGAVHAHVAIWRS